MDFKIIKEIISGWWNYITNNKQVMSLAEQRLSICARCPLNNKGTCDKTRRAPAIKDFTYRGNKRYAGVEYNGCGCPLQQKASSPNSQCPLSKWN